MKPLDLTGDIFGKLLVLERSLNTKRGNTTWLCKCECGNEKVVVSMNLKSGTTISCGCTKSEIMRENAIQRNTTHGHNTRRKPSRTHTSWSSMKKRCLNPNNTNYPDYGAKGVTVCERWLVFENFLSDMGERPVGKTLDRKNVLGNYEPDNCKWSTPSEQQRNKRCHVSNKT